MIDKYRLEDLRRESGEKGELARWVIQLQVELDRERRKGVDSAELQERSKADSNSHPAHGPVTLDRLRRIREILGKAAAQSDGGNLGYAMSDAVKAIDELLEVRKAEPVAWTDEQELRDVEKDGLGYMFTVNPITSHADPRRVIKLYRHAQPAPVVKLPHEFLSDEGIVVQIERVMAALAVAGIKYERKGDACRAAMLNGGK
ncbi:hypothetical protein [Citrobacter sp. CK180]|uniref:hypothetical protein n=1 Tax=Citrobacter sp. CK180 TaxID=2985089 RepID=UPI00257632EA|nr:hypothetical protein [Citrobacter sp. CK180]MDM3064359.1 hypothetical protein [Citrobacter sp. CK180]